MKAFLLSIALVALLSAQTSVSAPNGYRFPREADYSGDWKEFRATAPTPFVVRADFNGDAILDEAWLLPTTPGPGWGLFASLSSSNGSHHWVRLEQDRKTEVQGFGIALVEPGKYKTACGKGYWECKPNEPDVLDLKSAAVEFFKYESATSIFWWDRRSGNFRRTWISD